MKLPDRLPTLSGRWFAAYRILWWALLASALIGLTAGAWFTSTHTRALDRAYYGAGIRLTISNHRITVAPFGDETRGAFPIGSTLLAVDGHPVPSVMGEQNYDRIAHALGDDDGRLVRLTLRTPSGALRQVSVRRGPHHLAQSDRDAPMGYAARHALSISSSMATGLLMIVTAWLLFHRRPRDPVVALLSAGMLGLVAIFASGTALAMFGVPDSTLAVGVRLTSGSVLFAMAVFPSGQLTPLLSWAILPLIGVLVSSALLPDSLLFLGGWSFVASVMLTLGVVIWRFIRLPTGIERQQVKWAVFGIVAFVAMALSSIVLTRIDEYVTDNRLHFALLIGGNLLTTLSYAVLCAGLLVSLLRYRLYDADAAISRSATLAVLTLSLIAVFATTEKLIETLGEQWFGGSAGSAAGAVAAGLAAVLLVPLHRRLDHWAERRFQRNLVALRKLPDLVGDLRETASLERLGATALDRIVTTLRATGGAIVLEDGRVIGECGDGERPLRLPLADDACGQVGELRLGPRPDGTLYGKDEREALASVIGPLARAIAIVRERGETETRWQRLVSDLRESFDERLRALEARLPPPRVRRRTT